MKRSFVLCAPLAALALVLIGAMSFSPPALAQQPQQVEFSTYELFVGPQSVDLRPDSFQQLADSIRKAQTPGGCPLGRLRVRAPEGDPLFQEALAAARRDSILGALHRLGIPVAGRLFVDTAIFGGPDGHDTVYEIPRDRTPPTLRTTWDPPKGSKVQPDERIVVRMRASDGAARWQTGVKAIQLVAESDGGRDVAPTPVHYQACSEPAEKRVEATYVVPADPPPIVRLKATATDHANQTDFDTAEFPTGDFYGTFTYDLAGGGQPNRFHARADIVLNHDGKGNLAGTMVGQHRFIDYAYGLCTFRMVQPNRFRVSLVGSLTELSSARLATGMEGHTLKVFIGEVVEETGLIEEGRCPGGVKRIERKFKESLWNSQALLGTPSALGDGEVLADGTRQYKFAPEGPTGVLSTWTVTLRRARN